MACLSRLQALTLAVGSGLGVAYVMVPYSTATELVLYVAAVLVAATASVVAAWRRRTAQWVLVASALVGWLAGESIWWWYRARGLDPYPSPADYLFLVSYVPLALSAAVMAKRSRPGWDRAAILDAGVLTAVSAVPAWALLMEPYSSDSSIGSFEKTVTLGYPIVDLFVLGFVLQLLFTRAEKRRPTVLFAAGVVVTTMADWAFGWLELRGAYAGGSLVDLVFIIGYLLIGIAGLDDSAGSQRDAPSLGPGRGRLVVVVAAVLVPQVFLFSALAADGELGLSTASVAAGVSGTVILLVSIRMLSLLGHARRAEAHKGSQRLAALIDHSTDAIVLLDRMGTITFASPAVKALWSRDPEATTGTPLRSWFADSDAHRLAGQLQTISGTPGPATVELSGHLHDANGDQRAFEAVVNNLFDDPNVGALVVTMRDTTTRRELESLLERQAFHDPLTGLANRSLFIDRVDHAIQRSGRQLVTRAAVLFIDLDDFKAVNDGMGHAAGDELLRHVADRIQLCLRPGDTVARLGGDEFAVLLEDLPSVDAAEALAERTLEMLRLPIDVGDVSLGVSASIGVAPLLPNSTVQTVLSDADMAMYSAKASGKGRSEVFDEAFREAAQRQLFIRVELLEAVRSGQLRLAYQPIYSLGDQQLAGFEALSRWEHPVHGQIMPTEFISVAEESGLIVEFGRWVLERACAQAADWNRRSNRALTMSVNVSAVQLNHPSFIDDVGRILETTGLAPQLLTLELTESVLIESPRVTAVLTRLRDLNVRIAIDDFGTGYSALSYLHRFPVTSVKIDRSFTSQLGRSSDHRLVNSILAIAKALNLSTVAEGVETDDQLQTLESLECGFVQGYYLGRAESAEEVDATLAGLGTDSHLSGSGSAMQQA